MQRGGRLPRLAARRARRPPAEALLEAVGVERAGREPEPVAAALGHDQVLAQRARTRDATTWTAFRACCGPGTLPQLVDDAVEMDRGAVAHEQQRQQREGPTARHAGDPGFQLDLDGAEDPELDVHFAAEPIPVS